MSRIVLATLTLILSAGCQFSGGPEQSPEEFATVAVRAIAMNDFGAYLPLCAKGSDAVAAQGAKGLAEILGPIETEQIRADFGRAVRSNRLQAQNFESYRVELRVEEKGRWVFDVVDRAGQPMRVQIVVRELGSSYQLVGLNLL